VPAVKFDFFDRRSAERFAELLDETNGSHRHHNRGQADEQLAELVAIGHSLSAARSGAQVDSEFRVGLRAMLVATAERDGIGATATMVETEPGAHAGVREPGRGLLRSGSGRRIRVRGAIVISVAAGAMAVSGISAASENASPGDALYGVKRSTERAQLAMAGSDVTRGQLSLDFARTRLAEAAAMKGDDTSFGTVLNDMDNDTRQGVRLLTASAVAHKEAAPLTTVDSFVTSQRSAFEPVLSKLSPDNRQRAATSISLLDSVHQRAADLRTGLACDTADPNGTDPLGPKPGTCTAGKGSATTNRQQGTAEKQGSKPGGTPRTSTNDISPEQTGPTAAPGVAGHVVPDVEDPAAPDVEPSSIHPQPISSSTPTGDPGKGVLGGVLGGVLDR
jgi:uncharacterized protein DUF5667